MVLRNPVTVTYLFYSGPSHLNWPTTRLSVTTTKLSPASWCNSARMAPSACSTYNTHRSAVECRTGQNSIKHTYLHAASILVEIVDHPRERTNVATHVVPTAGPPPATPPTGLGSPGGEQVQRALVPGHGGPRQPRHVQLGLPRPAPSHAEYYLQDRTCEPFRKVK